MLEVGQIVKSIAGHDKNKFYMVVKSQVDTVMIADGKARKLDKPKQKNVLHVQKTNQTLDATVLTTDKKLRKALADYREELGEEGGY